MKKILVVHYAPGEYSHTDKTVEIVKDIVSEKAIVTELDLLKTPARVFDKDSLNAYVKRNYKNQVLDEETTSHLKEMDEMANQLLDTDILVLAYPMYNFNIPASVKAWIDSIVQSKKLFRYTDNGPEGLANVELMINLMSTGATRIGSSKDFATPYINFIMNFIGIQNIHTAGITQTNLVRDNSEKFDALKIELQDLFKNVLE